MASGSDSIELAKEKLSSVQEKMKRLYDCQAEQHIFSPGDQVLALLPVTGSPFCYGIFHL